MSETPARWQASMPVPAEHVSHYPPSLSGYTHGGCRCWACTAENTFTRQQQRAGLTRSSRRSFEDRVREELSV